MGAGLTACTHSAFHRVVPDASVGLASS